MAQVVQPTFVPGVLDLSKRGIEFNAGPSLEYALGIIQGIGNRQSGDVCFVSSWQQKSKKAGMSVRDIPPIEFFRRERKDGIIDLQQRRWLHLLHHLGFHRLLDNGAATLAPALLTWSAIVRHCISVAAIV